jgi:hypothetical protein
MGTVCSCRDPSVSTFVYEQATPKSNGSEIVGLWVGSAVGRGVGCCEGGREWVGSGVGAGVGGMNSGQPPVHKVVEHPQ